MVTLTKQTNKSQQLYENVSGVWGVFFVFCGVFLLLKYTQQKVKVLWLVVLNLTRSHMPRTLRERNENIIVQMNTERSDLVLCYTLLHVK